MRVQILFCGLLALTIGASAPVIAAAQAFPVTAGEHPGFTRVVVHTPPGTNWSLQGTDEAPRLEINPETARFDLSRLFQRIPRTRLERAEAQGATLTLVLACRCPITAWEERPGLIVLDIADPEVPPAPPPASPAPHLPRLAASLADPIEAGRSLAREIAARALPEQGDPALPTPIDRNALLRDLGLPVAQAVGQGLLDPAVDTSLASQILEQPAPPANPHLAPNLRITPVTERPDPDAPPLPEPDTRCQTAAALDFLTNGDIADFGEAYGRVSRALYGEFDQPSAQARLELIQLYLVSGFGAEARILLENGADPVAGRDLLLGLADAYEGRNTNSRMRLSQVMNCGGGSAMAALLAGASADETRRQAQDIALAFAQSPAQFRATAGPDIASRLIDAGALNAARVVADAMRRSPWVSPGDMAVIDARLDRMRGLDRAAVERLDLEADPRDTVPAMLERLTLALERHQAPPDGFLDDVLAMASAERHTDAGRELMKGLIRLEGRDGSLTAAFSALERLTRWLDDTSENRRLVAELRNETWQNVARRAGETDFIGMVLTRDDWRGEDLTMETREAIARRLLDLGVDTPVRILLASAESETARLLTARAALDQGDATTALALTEDAHGAEAGRLRAEALAALGRNEEAAVHFEALGALEEAARAALHASNWQMLERLAPSVPTAPRGAVGASVALSRAPGYLEDRADPLEEAVIASAPTAEQPQSDAPPATGGPGADVAANRASLPENMPERALPDAHDAPDDQHSAVTAVGARAAGLPAAGLRAEPRLEGAVPFDRMGLVTRGRHLVEESERLRDLLAPLLQDVGEP